MYVQENIVDAKLVDILNNLATKPKLIIINLGGGVQELLGYYLKRNLNFPVSILCSGAALSFITGDQVKLPSFVDNIFLGWLYRIFHNPKRFLIRYLKAFRLIWVFCRYRNFIFMDKEMKNNLLDVKKFKPQ